MSRFQMNEFGRMRDHQKQFNFRCRPLIKIESKAWRWRPALFSLSNEWQLSFGADYGKSLCVCVDPLWFRSQLLLRVRNLSCAPPLLLSSGSVCFAFLSRAEHLRVQHRKPLSLLLLSLSPRPSTDKSIKNQDLLHKHIPNLSANWALH